MTLELRLYNIGLQLSSFSSYVMFDFDAPPQSVQLILSRLQNNTDIIRASILKSVSP